MVPGFLAGLVVGFAASALILYVGRNYLDQTHVARLPSSDNDTVQFQFYDELEQSSSEEGKRPVDSEFYPAGTEGNEQTEQEVAASQEPHTSETSLQQDASTVAGAQSEPTASVQTSEKIFLQVGFFSEFDRAQKQRAVLLLEGYQVNTIESKSQNGSGTRYRVLVGPYSNSRESEEAIASLQALELTPFVYK